MKTNTTKYINNRKASFDYIIEEKYHAGIVLTGSEVKSIRGGHCNIIDAFCYFDKDGLVVKNMMITSFNKLMFSHNERQDRRLLLTKKELRKIQNKTKQKGYTIIPLSIETPTAGYIKMNIGICKGKHNYDKRNAIKERDISRDMRREE